MKKIIAIFAFALISFGVKANSVPEGATSKDELTEIIESSSMTEQENDIVVFTNFFTHCYNIHITCSGGNETTQYHCFSDDIERDEVEDLAQIIGDNYCNP